jgi:adenosylhomocysteine nucleosidase
MGIIVVQTGLQQEADIPKGVPGLLVLCGPSQRDNLADLAPADAAGYLSFGVAGGLAPDLHVGALTVASSVIVTGGTTFAPDAAWTAKIVRLAGAQSRPLFSDPRELAATPALRASLRTATGADVVDEESFAVARIASERGRPFAVIRTISDSSDEAVSPAELDATNADGSPNIWGLVDGIFENPGQLPGVIKSGPEFECALYALRKTLRKLGPRLGLAA